MIGGNAVEDEEELARKQIEQFKADIEQTTNQVTDAFYKAIGRGIARACTH